MSLSAEIVVYPPYVLVQISVPSFAHRENIEASSCLFKAGSLSVGGKGMSRWCSYKAAEKVVYCMGKTPSTVLSEQPAHLNNTVLPPFGGGGTSQVAAPISNMEIMSLRVLFDLVTYALGLFEGRVQENGARESRWSDKFNTKWLIPKGLDFSTVFVVARPFFDNNGALAGPEFQELCLLDLPNEAPDLSIVYGLRCIVVIEIKTGSFTWRVAGKLHFPAARRSPAVLDRAERLIIAASGSWTIHGDTGISPQSH
ncbi:hypothetical protein EV421DRAFT_1989327 [Armillaria borealis]|uniref:Uncharacterized protein n=1 Tax=Armillaria borealis TaxID=47425 RepID=A0AA39J3K9_9AGAR|nr:hypothetical protein EV421DRAFT_1989327 [Armillaria borealis]